MNNNDNDPELNRLARLESVKASWTDKDRLKADVIVREVREGLARVYSDRLQPAMVDRIADSALITPEATVTIKTNLNQLPTDRKGWDNLARDLVNADWFATANVISSDSVLKEQLTAEFMRTLSPITKMNLYRSGQLDEKSRSYVEAKLAMLYVEIK